MAMLPAHDVPPRAPDRSVLREVGGVGVIVVVVSLAIFVLWSPVGLAGVFCGAAVLCFASYAAARLGQRHPIAPDLALFGICAFAGLALASFVAALT